MRVLTMNELVRMAKIELCGLAARITNILPDFPEGSPEAKLRTSTCAESAGSWRVVTSHRDAHGNAPAGANRQGRTL